MFAASTKEQKGRRTNIMAMSNRDGGFGSMGGSLRGRDWTKTEEIREAFEVMDVTIEVPPME
jgi:hypothetical protein